jgi:hypothetical protein
MFCAPRVIALTTILLATPIFLTTALCQEDRPIRGADQAVRGHLLDLETRGPVLAGTVTLLLSDERIVATGTDEEGFFVLPVPNPGVYQLEARRLGYATAVSQTFRVSAGDTLTVQFGVSPDAVPLEPLLVVGHTNRGANRFSAHKEEWGVGIFLTPAMIDSIAPRHYGDVFRKQEDIWLSWGWGTLSTGAKGPVPKIRTFKGHGCLTYMVNRTPITQGNRYILEAMAPERIVAVEIYRYPGEVPPDLRNFQDMTVSSSWSGPLGGASYSSLEFMECGVAVYWTREGW